MGNDFTKREQILILIIVVGVLAGLGFRFINKDNQKPKDEDPLELLGLIEEENEDKDVIEGDININDDIMIHISGQVYSPGLIKLKSGDRLIDAVELAGGLRSEADIDKINLAKKLLDEEKIYIPKIGEEDIPEMVSTAQTPNSSSGSGDNGQGKININNCTREELISLPGIGEVTADKIIQYREENSFNTIEDIKNVSGIGEKKFEAMKELITIN